MINRKSLLRIPRLLEVARHELFSRGDRPGVADCDRIIAEIGHHLDFQTSTAFHATNQEFLERHTKLAFENCGKIEAIKLHKRLTGLALIDSKQYVEELAHNQNWKVAK